MDFTLSCTYRVVPLYERVALSGSLLWALLLCALYFRWGLRGRPAAGAALLLATLPWMLGTQGTAWSWIHLQELADATGADSLSISMYLIGIRDALRLQAATAGLSALLLFSLAGVLALEARTRRPVRSNRILLCFALSVMFAALSAGSRAAFLAQLGAEGLPWDGFPVGPWTWLSLAQLVAAGLALWLLGARRRHAPGGGPRSRTLLLTTLLVLGHGAQLLAQRWMFSELNERSAATPPRPPSG